MLSWQQQRTHAAIVWVHHGELDRKQDWQYKTQSLMIHSRVFFNNLRRADTKVREHPVCLFCATGWKKVQTSLASTMSLHYFCCLLLSNPAFGFHFYFQSLIQSNGCAHPLIIIIFTLTSLPTEYNLFIPPYLMPIHLQSSKEILNSIYHAKLLNLFL